MRRLAAWEPAAQVAGSQREDSTSMGMVKDVWDIACDIGEKVFQFFHKRREQGKPEKVLSVMTRNKTWRRADIAKLSNISEDDALQALHVLKDAAKVMSIEVDEEPDGTFWRRI